MSGGAELIVFPAIGVGIAGVVVVGVAAYGTAIAAAELGKGTAEVAILASEAAEAAVVGVVDKFRDEYRGVRADVEARVAQLESETKDRESEAAAAGQAAAAVAAATHVEAGLDASLEMVRRQADLLMRRVEATPGAPAALQRRARELVDAAGSGDEPDPVAPQRLAEDLTALSAEFTSWAASLPRERAQGGKAQRDLVNALVAAVRELLASDEVMSGVSPLVHQDVEVGLAACEELAVRQPTIAIQSLAVAQRRLGDELARARGAAHEGERGRRLLAGSRVEIEAQLLTVRDRAQREAFRMRAGLLLKTLDAYERGGATVVEVGALEREAERLFTQSAADLAAAALDQFAADTVRDVLAELGCSVREVEGGGAAGGSEDADRFVAEVGDGYGVEFAVAPGAQVSTELVGLDGEFVFEEGAEDRACSLVDAVTEGLRRRRIDVAPGPRRSLASVGALRRVDLMAKPRGRRAEAPKRRSVDGRK